MPSVHRYVVQRVQHLATVLGRRELTIGPEGLPAPGLCQATPGLCQATGQPMRESVAGHQVNQARIVSS